MAIKHLSLEIKHISILGASLATVHVAATLPGVHIKHKYMTKYRTVKD